MRQEGANEDGTSQCELTSPQVQTCTHLGSNQGNSLDRRLPDHRHDVAESRLQVRPHALVHVLVLQLVGVALKVLQQRHPDGAVGRRVHAHERLYDVALVLLLVQVRRAVGGGREVEDDGEKRGAA